MKKIFFFLAAMALAITANAKVTTISPDAENDALRLAVHYAEDGDIIEMTEGTYVQCNNGYVAFDGKSVTVKAAEGANVVLQLQVPITLANGGKATLQGIKIDASRLTELADWYEHVIYANDATEGKQLVMDGCELYSFNMNKSAIYSKADNKLDLCRITNCYFHDVEKSCLFFEGTSIAELSVTNSTFANNIAKVTESYYAGIIDVRNADAKVTVDHCTFYNCLLMNTDYAAITMKGPQAANVVISNNIFMLPEAIDGHRAIRESVEATNCMTFNYVKDNGGIHSSVTKTNCQLNVDPLFVDTANCNFALADGSPAIGAATDGSNLGDPRWNAPAVEEPEYDVMDITMTNLVVQEMEDFVVLTASDDSNTGLNVMLAVNEDGSLAADSYMALIQGWNEVELPIVEGNITKAYNEELATDVYTGLVVVEYMEGKLGLNLTMYAKPVVVTDVVVTDATITVETGDDGMGGTYEMINVTANWNESVLKLEGVEKEFEGFLQITETFVVDGEEDWYIWMCMNGVITTVDNVLTVTGEFKNNFTGDVYNVTISGKLPVAEEPAPLKGIVKRALTIGESTIVLTHEADGTPHIYNIKGEKITELSQEGIIAVDPENAGDLLAISDIAATEDGKLVAVNQMICQADASYVDEGYKRGENRFYIWNDLAGAPSVWFKSIQYANWFRSNNGYTMAIKGTSTNATIALSGYHATKSWARIANYKVIDGVYTEPANSAEGNECYTWCEGTAAGDIDDNVIGKKYELNASPLAAENWIVDGDLVNPIEYTTPAEIKAVLTTVTPISVDLGKKFNGATYVTVDDQVLMFAPYANADGKLVGVKVLDITEGLDSIAELAVLDLEAPVAATAAATAVAIAAYDVNITLVVDGYIYPLTYTLPKPERTEVTVSRVLAYDLSSTLSEDSTTLTVNYTLNANADAVEVVILNGEEVVKTVPCKGINKGTYTVEIATAGLPQDKLTWAVNAKGAPISEMVEVTDQSRGIYDFYNMMDVLVDNDPESEYFSKIYIQMAYNGASDGATDRADVQTAGLFIYDQELDELNNPSNVGIKPTLPEGYTMGDNRNKFHRLDINPNTGDLTYCYNVKGQPAVFAIDRANLTGEVTNLLSGVEGLTQTAAHCFDAEGALYVMDLPAAGTIYKIVDGVATVFAASDSKWVNASMTLASDGRGGLWVAQNRGQIDTYYQLAHYTKDGALDFAVYQGNENGFTGSSTRGALAYDASRHLLAQGRNGKVEVYSVAYNAETGVPALTLVATTPSVGTNIDGLHFDYAGDLYVVNSSKEKFQKFAMPTNNNACSTPAASKYAFSLEAAETPAPGITLTATGLETTLDEDGSYTLQGQAVVNGDESNLMDFMLTVYPTEGYTNAFLDNWAVMIFDAPTPGAFVENADGTFTYTAQLEYTDWDDLTTIYNINMSGTIKKTEGPEYTEKEDEITNMVFDFDNMVMYGGPSTNYEVEVFLGLAEDNLDGTFTLSSESSVAIKGIDAEFIEGYAYDIDPSAPSAKAVVKVNWDGMYYAFTLTMTAAPLEAIEIVITDATVEVEEWKDFPEAPTTNYALTMTADWTNPADSVVYPVKVELPIYDPNATEPVDALSMVKVGDGETLLGVVDGEYLKVTTVEGVVTATGLVANPATGFAVNITISGKLPETAVDNIQVGVKAIKVIKNGQLIIINNDVEYSAQGQVIK